MTKQLLSQEEIDALLEGIKSDHLDVDHVLLSNESNARPVNFTHYYHEHSRLPVLQMINERFVRCFSIRLSDLLHKSCEISRVRTKTMKFIEYAKELPTLATLNVVQINPLRGNALFILEAPLISSVIDLLFGGEGRYPARIEARPFTANENRIVQLILGEIFSSLEEAWAPLLTLSYEFIRAENKTDVTAIAGSAEWVVMFHFQIKLEGCGGNLHVVLPYKMLEPIRHLLDASAINSPLEKDEIWCNKLREQVFDAELEISSTLAEIPFTIRDFLSLRPGDVIPIDLSGLTTLSAAQIPLLRGNFCKSNGCNAVSVVGPLGQREHKNKE